ncbi:putative ribonuclease H-like domain-containing protein [Tanacetum coccineum]
MLWHMRLGHVNFKTINKLVKENIVRGLPSKHFENDQTCVACLKGKQHKASCKSKIQNSITQPLFMLQMDLFGLTFVSSLMHKKYCLVVPDDYSRFTWVFFLATKDETSGILKSFITEVENLVDKKVKLIRSDNGTKFKNRVMSEFCEKKGIKKEFSVVKTPQQNGVAERRNRTLIEAAGTMLADSKLPTTFWDEVVNTACYVHNMVLVVKPHNKTPYELFRGRTSALSFMRPFGCHVIILNTLDYLGKFNGKSDERLFVGYSMNSKAFRVYNIRIRKVEENLHIRLITTTSSNTENKDDEGVSKASEFNDQEQPENSTPNINTVGPRKTYEDLHTCLFACFLSHEEPKRIAKALCDPACVEAMQEELLQNKKGINRHKCEAISYLIFASFMGFMVYQMDVKSAFLYGTIKEEVYVCQPPRFEDADYPNKVYKVVKALYGLHQAPRVWTASTPIDTEKPLLKDSDGDDVDVHIYRSMIGSLMYLTSSRPDIMFAVCACARFQVTPKVSHSHAVKSIIIDQGLGSTSGIRACALRNFDLEVMEFENTQNNALAKLPMLKLEEYEMWEIKIKQYFQIQDYALWEVIENGNSWVPIPETTPPESGTSTTIKMTVPATIEEKTCKKNDVKARSLLLMALPNEHQLTFDQYVDAQSMFAAIKARFGGNEATKKTQKALLKQQY